MKKEPSSETISTHAYVFRCSFAKEKKIRAYLLGMDATLIFQKHGIQKFYITEKESA